MLERDDVLAARDRHENITDRGSVHHRHNLITVHHSLKRADGIDLGHDDLCTKSLRAQRNALAAPAVAGHHDIFPCDDEISGSVDAVPNRLASAVAIVEEMFAGCIVDQHHRELQSLDAVHLLKT